MRLLLNDINSLEEGNTKAGILAIAANFAISIDSENEELLHWIAREYPDALPSVSNELWSGDEERAMRIFRDLEPRSAELFLLGAIGSKQQFSSETVKEIVAEIRSMALYDPSSKNHFEAQFLSQNLEGNVSFVEQLLNENRSEVVRERLLPLLAKEKFDHNLEQAYYWVLDFEGGLKTKPVDELYKEWKLE